MRRSLTGCAPTGKARATRIAPLFTVVLVLAAQLARAQSQPPPFSEVAPPVSKPPTTDTTPFNGAPPTAPVPPPPAPVPEPPASPPATAPTLTPESAPATPLTLELRPAPPPPRPAPFYQKAWFWAAVGVVFASVMIIAIASSGSSGPDTPNTILGDKHAF